METSFINQWVEYVTAMTPCATVNIFDNGDAAPSGAMMYNHLYLNDKFSMTGGACIHPAIVTVFDAFPPGTADHTMAPTDHPPQPSIQAAQEPDRP